MQIETNTQVTPPGKEGMNETSRGRFGPGVQRFFEVPVEKMGFRYWGEHFRNFGIVLMFATVGSYVATHNTEFDPNFPMQGRVIGFVMLYLACIIGGANVVQPFLAIAYHARDAGGKWKWALMAAGYAWLTVESAIVVAILAKELAALAAHFA